MLAALLAQSDAALATTIEDRIRAALKTTRRSAWSPRIGRHVSAQALVGLGYNLFRGGADIAREPEAFHAPGRRPECAHQGGHRAR
jgi:hypothetical protein